MSTRHGGSVAQARRAGLRTRSSLVRGLVHPPAHHVALSRARLGCTARTPAPRPRRRALPRCTAPQRALWRTAQPRARAARLRARSCTARAPCTPRSAEHRSANAHAYLLAQLLARATVPGPLASAVAHGTSMAPTSPRAKSPPLEQCRAPYRAVAARDR
ncbi:hypothetical protein [Paraburkholderia sp. A1RO-1]|uniref:hypothetical protein n=1 Tax=Paraburkholderia sp. A1RO-1 TaxID=3028368 RepID=UPI003B766C1E